MVARSMLSGLFESCYAASVELEDIMNRERRLVTFDGPPESHAVICKFLLSSRQNPLLTIFQLFA